LKNKALANNVFPSFAKAELSKSFLHAVFLPSWDRRGNEPRNEASGAVLNDASAASLL